MSDLNVQGFLQALHATSATAKHRLGTKRITDDGRTFRYAKAGAVALDPSKCGIGLQDTDNHVDIAMAKAAAVGAMQVTVTLGATLATVDQYRDGLLVVTDGTGEGYSYQIDSNPACDSAGDMVVTLKDTIRSALATSGTTVTLYPSFYNGVTVSTAEENIVVGVPLVAVPINNYYWAQTGGLAVCLCGGTAPVGAWLCLDASVAGALHAVSETIGTTVDYPLVAYQAYGAQVDTEYKPVFLIIEG